jgi:oxygen-independent coproporphyrinogen-3 oxidase
LRKCGYCSFFSLQPDSELQKRYLRNLIAEIRTYSSLLTIQPSTLYFGGGTPSLLKGENVGEIMEQFDLSKLQECTIEVNPATVEFNRLLSYKELSVNRLSLGLQSFVDKELLFLGRIHKSEDNYSVYDSARKCGFDNISVDMIYGLPGQTLREVRYSLKAILDLAPEHISTYNLSLEPETPIAQSGTKLPSDEITATFYRYIREKLEEEGYAQYEISNFSRTPERKSYKGTDKGKGNRDYRSKHNLSYWMNEQYIGFGCSSHSYVGKYRYYNSSDLRSYFNSVSDKTVFPNKEVQDLSKQKKDFVIQSLRMTDGLNIAMYKREFREDFLDKFHEKIIKHDAFLEIKEGFLRLKPEGYFVSNEIIVDFIE